MFSDLLRIAGVQVALFLVVGWWVGTGRAPAETTPGGGAKHFVGSGACAVCHAAEYKAWQSSHHAAAMQEADDRSVLGRFDGSSFVQDGVESTFFKRDGKFWVRTDGPDGRLADFPVAYTFGLTPLQQYLIALPGGRLQALGLAWDSRPAAAGGQRWYHLYPDRKLKAGDPLHWTGIDQNWNYQCAWCHATNLRKAYDLATRTYATTWSELGVGCEACHGPASAHVAWARGDRKSIADPARGFPVRLQRPSGPLPQAGAPLPVPKAGAGVSEIEVCASCHARRGQFSDDPNQGREVGQAFRVTGLEAGAYYVDGQQKDEVFNHGSFVQSRMHAAGVTCSNCHEPHAGRLRAEGNAVCTQCHAAGQFDRSEHHHHPAGSAGSACTSCHMPTTTYMGVDARHDHSMRIPRPDRTHLLGTPNACTGCHADKPARWAADQIKAWSPAAKPGAQSFAEAFDLGDRGAPGAQAALLAVAADRELAGLVRASALSRLARYPSPRGTALARQALADPDPDVRVAAVAVLATAPPALRQQLLVPLLDDPVRLVRMDAASALAGEPEAGLDPDARAKFDLALEEYVAAQRFNADRPENLMNLGSLNLRRRNAAEARAGFEEALAVDPSFVPAYVALADLERMRGDEAAAETVLRRGLAAQPGAGALHQALGLSLVRQRKMDAALEALAEAVRRDPNDPRSAYVLAVAQHSAGRRSAAMGTLRAALARNPYDRDLLTALLSYESEVRDFASALSRAELLAALEPERPDVAQLVTRLRAQAR